MKTPIKHLATWWLILTAFVLALGGASASATGVAQVPLTRSVSVPIFEESLPSSSSALESPSSIKDYAGNAFDSWVRRVGNDTRVVIQKRTPAGILVAQHQVTAYEGRKIEDAAIFLDGDDVAVREAAYALTSPNRINGIEIGRWPDIAVPFPNGVNPALGAGASTYTAQAAAEVDYERIKREVASEIMAQLKTEFRGGELRQILEDKAKDAIGESFNRALYDTDPRARYAQDAALPWFRDRAYQGATSALENVGVCTP